MLEDGDGRPSRWNTLRALRVLGVLRPLKVVNPFMEYLTYPRSVCFSGASSRNISR